MSTSSPMGIGRAFGTFGELLQGVHGQNGLDFLVTFPIGLFARATFAVQPLEDELVVTPATKRKALRLAKMILEHYELPLTGSLHIESEIPVGKGMASSSADMVAAARAVANCYALDIPHELLQSFMREIEPSDGVMYEGTVAFYHRKVELCEYMGVMTPLTVVGIDEGGEIDTVEFNKRPKVFTDEDKQEYTDLLKLASDAIRNDDKRLIGEVATRSSLLNQKQLPKKHLTKMMNISEEIGGLGVIVAHSGTCIGLLLDPEEADYTNKVQQATARMEELGAEVTLYHSWHPQQELQQTAVNK